MKRIGIFLMGVLLVLVLSSCGGGARGTVTGMAGTWVASPSLGGVTYTFTLDISGSDDDFSGRLEVEAMGYTTTAANFTGSRSGNAVEIVIFRTPYEGVLSGNRLTFNEFYYATIVSRGSITFNKR